jgi:bifunctional non-homologous end joining protein LigD
MLLLPTEQLPAGPKWVYELKPDGFRAEAIKSGGRVQLRSRNNKDFNGKYPAIVGALAAIPDETVIDGEIVALDSSGRPSFSGLQNYGSGETQLFYYAFDVMILEGRDVMAEPLIARRALLRSQLLAHLDDPIRESSELHASLPELIQSVKFHGLEGLVAKRRDSRYEAGQRYGAWQKMRVNRSQEFVIAGYARGQEFRCHRSRLLRRRQTHLRGAHAMASRHRHAISCTIGSRAWVSKRARSRTSLNRKVDGGARALQPRK